MSIIISFTLIIPINSFVNKLKASEIVIGWNEKIPNLDPQKHVDISAWSAMINVQEPLVFRNDNGDIKPHLAKSWKRINSTTWEFNLRKGIKFHNGEDFNSKAVKFTFFPSEIIIFSLIRNRYTHTQTKFR